LAPSCSRKGKKKKKNGKHLPSPKIGEKEGLDSPTYDVRRLEKGGHRTKNIHGLEFPVSKKKRTSRKAWESSSLKEDNADKRGQAETGRTPGSERREEFGTPENRLSRRGFSN